MSVMPRRRFTRVDFGREATLDFASDSYCLCKIKNLSLGGMYLACPHVEKEDLCCKVVFKQTGPSSNLTVRAQAKIVRHDNDGLALKFTSMEQESYMFLKIILLYQAKDPFTVSLEYPDNSPFNVWECDSSHLEKNGSCQ